MNAIFWGFFLILLGVSLVLKAAFGWDLPILKVAFGCLLIFWGAQMIFNFPTPSWEPSKKTGVAFNSKGYNTVFGKQTVDLSSIKLGQHPTYINTNTVFGTTEILLDRDIPTEINVSTVFSTVDLPQKDLEMVNSRQYITKNGDRRPHLVLTINAAFGTVLVKTR